MNVKFFFALLFVLVFFSACENEEEAAELSPLGTWQLTAVLTDNGDGSGSFKPVTSDREITLLADNTYRAKGNLCSLEEEGQNATVGVYDRVAQTMWPENCVTMGGTPLGLEIEGDQLTITYLCFEGCAHRYTRK